MPRARDVTGCCGNYSRIAVLERCLEITGHVSFGLEVIRDINGWRNRAYNLASDSLSALPVVAGM